MKFLFILLLLVSTSVMAKDKTSTYYHQNGSFTSHNSTLTEAWLENAQTTVPDSSYCSCLKPFFDYLLASGRLNIRETDNITVQSLVNDAINAGYTINTTHCTILSTNLGRSFFTTTPQYVDLPNFIVAPEGASYRAMLGNCKLKFSPIGTRFEHKLSQFYPEACSSQNQVRYAAIPATAQCLEYTIERPAENSGLNWYVSYTDCQGIAKKQWFHPAERSYTFCATVIHSIQDVDTINLVHVASVHELTSIISPTCTFDPANYFRPTLAVLEVEECGSNLRLAATGTLEVKAFPNPSPSEFTVLVNSTSNEPIQFKIVDFTGKIVETSTKSSSKNNLRIGAGYKSGIYFLETKQGNQRQLIKMVKN